MTEQFISEPIKPVPSTLDAERMAAGEPGLPAEFIWHGETLVIARVCRSWRETGPCRHGSGEQYVRKHWYEVLDNRGRTLKIYFERNPRGKQRRTRWRLYSANDNALTAEPSRKGRIS